MRETVLFQSLGLAAPTCAAAAAAAPLVFPRYLLGFYKISLNPPYQPQAGLIGTTTNGWRIKHLGASGRPNFQKVTSRLPLAKLPGASVAAVSGWGESGQGACSPMTYLY